MAEIRTPVPSPATAVARPVPAQRVQAAREAQRAFFNAALAGAPEPAPLAAATVGQVPALAKTGPSLAAPDPRLRPGSIVDIKV